MSNDRSGLREVDLNWPPDQIKEFCESTDDWVLTIDRRLLPADIEALYQRQLTVPAPYEGLIAEIAGDERTPQRVVEDIFTRFQDSQEIMASLATSVVIPDEVLRELARNRHPSVREHAKTSLGRRMARNEQDSDSA